MQDDFSNLTSCPSSMTKCPLHHIKVLMQGACKMTFQISPHIHLAWPRAPSTTPKFSHEVHMRWLFKFYLLTFRPSSVTKSPLHHTKVLTWGANEMTFQISPRIHLAWPSVPSTTKVLMHGAHEMTFQISPHIHLAWPSVLSTTQKFSHELHVRWVFKFHLASI